MKISWRRMVIRHRLGRCAPESLASVLEAEIGHQVETRQRLRVNNIELFRRWGSSLLQEVDAGTEEAMRRLRRQDFRGAAKQVREVEVGLESLARLDAAIGTYETARLERERLVEGFFLKIFSELPLLRILQRLLRRTVILLDQGEFRKAAFVADLSRRLIGRLSTRSKTPDLELLRRLDSLIAEVSTADDPQRAAAELWTLRRLAEGGYPDLAERLADELELLHFGWRRAATAARVHDLGTEVENLGKRAQLTETRITQWLNQRVARIP